MALHHGDKKAAFIGMIVTALLLVAMSFTIVKLTNAKFAREKGEAKAESK
jgi:hypothetical protein